MEWIMPVGFVVYMVIGFVFGYFLHDYDNDAGDGCGNVLLWPITLIANAVWWLGEIMNDFYDNMHDRFDK